MEPTALSADDRLKIAKLSGAVSHWAAGDLAARRDDAYADLFHITNEARLWGVVLGNVLARIELQGWTHEQATADFLRWAGADEPTAAARLAWQRERYGRRGHL